MLAEIFVAAFFALIVALALWALFGLFLMPVFGENTVLLLFSAEDGRELEVRTRGVSWLRDQEKNGGRLVIVDCGLTEEGLCIVEKLREKYPWVDYCPNQTLPDYIELLQHCLEKEKEL